MTTHSRTLAWKIPWMEEPGGLQSMGSQRVGHDWVTSLSLFTFMHWRRKWQPHSRVLAWRIPGTEEPGGLLSLGSHRVGHDWSDLAAADGGCHIDWASFSGNRRKGRIIALIQNWVSCSTVAPSSWVMASGDWTPSFHSALIYAPWASTPLLQPCHTLFPFLELFTTHLSPHQLCISPSPNEMPPLPKKKKKSSLTLSLNPAPAMYS